MVGSNNPGRFKTVFALLTEVIAIYMRFSKIQIRISSLKQFFLRFLISSGLTLYGLLLRALALLQSLQVSCIRCYKLLQKILGRNKSESGSENTRSSKNISMAQSSGAFAISSRSIFHQILNRALNCFSDFTWLSEKIAMRFAAGTTIENATSTRTWCHYKK